MHSPIFYITEKVGTTVDEMKDSLPTEEEFFYLVEETDWFELNTTDDATWHRGQYDNPQLAFEVGLHRTYIGAVERGEKNITILNLIKIKNALNVSMSQIYIEREE